MKDISEKFLAENERQLTSEKLGQMMNMSQERVEVIRQIQSRAILRLRHSNHR